MKVHELRIHGVGGSPGEKLLGMSNPDDAIVVGEGLGTVFLARRRDESIEGYDWGGLTSASPLQALWVLLLPFTLVNVAGWAHPAFERIGRRRLNLLRLLVHAAAGLLTASWVLWFAIVSVDYLGYQWLAPRSGWPPWAAAGIGLVVTVAAIASIWWIAARTRSSFEAVPPDAAVREDGGEQPERWGPVEELSSPAFFAHEDSMTTRLRWHVGVIAATLVAIVAKAGLSWGEDRLLLGEVFVVVGAAQVAVILALVAVSWTSGGQYPDRPVPRALPAAAVALAVALTNGFFSGLALLVAQRFDGVRWGPELALMDGFVWVLGLWGLLAVGWALAHRARGNADELPDRDPRPARLLEGVDDRWRARIAAVRGTARAAHEGPRLLAWLGGVFLLVSGILSLYRLDIAGDVPPWQWLQTPADPGLSMRAATWLLPLVVLSAMGLVWRSTRRRSLRQGVGILWDVLTFWPRRYHPLAVRPYTERAVPEFQARIRHLTVAADQGLLVSAHSQGTVIAFAALASLDDRCVGRTALLTYGSPITTLYGQAFPAYFGQDPVERLRHRLGAGVGRWHNLWRRTDPIGGPVIGAGDGAVDEELADPATEPPREEDRDDPEPVRRPWVELCGHSYYYRERRYKALVAELRSAVASAPSERETAGGPGGDLTA